MPHHAGAEGNWRGTFQALPSGQPAARQGEWVMADPVLQVRDLEVSFRVDTGTFFRRNYQRIRAVNGISFDVHRAETLGIVGESGCGKSTLARAILGQARPARPDSVARRGPDAGKRGGPAPQAA